MAAMVVMAEVAQPGAMAGMVEMAGVGLMVAMGATAGMVEMVIVLIHPAGTEVTVVMGVTVVTTGTEVKARPGEMALMVEMEVMGAVIIHLAEMAVTVEMAGMGGTLNQIM